VEDLAIDRIETAILDVALRRPHRFARTGRHAQPILLVTVTTRGGAP
jgi:muconate cycloisomerase